MATFKSFYKFADITPPTVPTNLAVVVGTDPATELDISWDASTDSEGIVAGYKLFRDGVEIMDADVLIFNDVGLTADTTYTYTVLAYDNVGNESAQSAGVDGSTELGILPVSFVSHTTARNANSVTSLTINKPASVIEGNIMVFCFNLLSASMTSVPDGWLALSGNYYYKVATASEPSSYTWGWNNTARPVITIVNYTNAAGIGVNNIGTGTTFRSIVPTSINSAVFTANFTSRSRDWDCSAIPGTTTIFCQTNSFNDDRGGLRTVDSVVEGVATPTKTVTWQDSSGTIEILGF